MTHRTHTGHTHTHNPHTPHTCALVSRSTRFTKRLSWRTRPGRHNIPCARCVMPKTRRTCTGAVQNQARVGSAATNTVRQRTRRALALATAAAPGHLDAVLGHHFLPGLAASTVEARHGAHTACRTGRTVRHTSIYRLGDTRIYDQHAAGCAISCTAREARRHE